MKITIPNWNKFNPRSDRANYSWFRLENRLFESLFRLGDAEKVTYLFLLCEASKKNSASFDLDPQLAAALLRHTEKSFLNQLDVISKLELVSVGRHDDGVVTAPLPATRRNETNETKRNVYGGIQKFDFTEIYALYPKKEGKQAGLTSCKSQIKCQEDFNLLKQAVERYTAHCQAQGIEKQFIKHFSTFVSAGKWRDWLDPETGTATVGESVPFDIGRILERDGAL